MPLPEVLSVLKLRVPLLELPERSSLPAGYCFCLLPEYSRLQKGDANCKQLVTAAELYGCRHHHCCI